MKQYLYLFALQLFVSGTLFSQCVNHVSTHHEDPVNNVVPDNAYVNNDPNQGNQFENTFNWFPVSNGFYSGYSPVNMVYAGNPITYLSNIMDAQSSPTYYNYIYDGPLPLNKNGWELLLVNLGTFPNGDIITVANGQQPGLPYIVIYNKYSGVVRVFFSYGIDGEGADAVEVELRFQKDNELSGLLRLANAKDIALDQPTTVKLVKSVAKDPI